MTRLPDTSQQVADEGEEERVSRLLTGLSAMAILFLLGIATSPAKNQSEKAW